MGESISVKLDNMNNDDLMIMMALLQLALVTGAQAWAKASSVRLDNMNNDDLMIMMALLQLALVTGAQAWAKASVSDSTT